MADFGTNLIVDETDYATQLFDLDSGSAGAAANPGGLYTQTREYQLRAPGRVVRRSKFPNAPGGTTSYASDDLVQTQFMLEILGPASVDGLKQGMGRLQQLLSRRGLMKVVPTGASDAWYLRYEPADQLPGLLFEPEDTFRLIASHQYPRVPILLTRQPVLLGEAITSADNALANGDMVLDSNLDGRPDSWSWAVATSISAEAIQDDAYTFRQAASLTRNWRQATGAASAANGQAWAYQFEARLTPGGVNGGAATAAAIIEFLDNASAVLTTSTITQVALTSGWQRYTVLFTAANASTDRVRGTCRFVTGGGGNSDIEVRKGKLEQAATVTPYSSAGVRVTNNPSVANGRSFSLYVPGDAPAQVAFELSSPDASATLSEVLLAKRWSGGVDGQRALPDWLNSTHYCICSGTGNGWTIALTNNTSSVADSGAAGGNAAQCTFASNPTIMAKRIKATRTTRLDSLRGRWDVYLRCKATAADVYAVQLRWAAGVADPAPNVNDETTLDASQATSFDYVDLYLGRIRLPEAPAPLGQVTLEVWERQDSGGGNLNNGTLNLVPVDEPAPMVSRLSVGEASLETWQGKKLASPPYKLTTDATWTAGAPTGSGSGMKLSANHQGAGTPPNTGLPWPAGRHRVTFHLGYSGFYNMFITTRVVDVGGGGAGSVVATRDWTPTDTPGPIFWLAFDSVAGHLYQPQVVITTYTSGDVIVQQIDHEFTPSALQNETLATDPGRYAAEKWDTSGKLVTNLDVDGPTPGLLEPGLHVLYVSLGDVSIDGELPESVLARLADVAWSFRPGFYG